MDSSNEDQHPHMELEVVQVRLLSLLGYGETPLVRRRFPSTLSAGWQQPNVAVEEMIFDGQGARIPWLQASNNSIFRLIGACNAVNTLLISRSSSAPLPASTGRAVLAQPCLCKENNGSAACLHRRR